MVVVCYGLKWCILIYGITSHGIVVKYMVLYIKRENQLKVKDMVGNLYAVEPPIPMEENKVRPV